MMNKKNFGIYVHIPFCLGKCNYCNFVSGRASNQEIKKYVAFLINEINANATKYKDREVSSIYFGGGTPSLINSGYIKSILNAIKKHFKVRKTAEISIECNPCSFTKFKAEQYFKMGINRISFGVQSLCNKELKVLGRRHTKNQAIKAIDIAKNVGFKNISCDLMIGIPNQTKQSLLGSAVKLIELGVTHISAYMLMLEEGTLLCKMVQDGCVNVANDDECVDLYNELAKTLKHNKFNRYEISNFAIKGFKCLHNTNYWQMGEYIGFGVAAHSFVDGVRFNNSNSVKDYYLGKSNYEKLTNEQIIEETIMLALRTKQGLNLTKLKQMGYDLQERKRNELEMLKHAKLIKVKKDILTLTNKAYGLCSAIVLQLI